MPCSTNRRQYSRKETDSAVTSTPGTQVRPVREIRGAVDRVDCSWFVTTRLSDTGKGQPGWNGDLDDLATDVTTADRLFGKAPRINQIAPIERFLLTVERAS